MYLMRVLPIIVLLFLAYLPSNAQTEKGRFALSGSANLGFLSTNTKIVIDSTSAGEVKNQNIHLSPSFAYFINNNLAVGISGTYSYARTKTSNMFAYSQTVSLAAIPSVFYFIPAEGKLRPVLGAGVGYYWLFDDNTDARGLTLNGSAGVSYFITRNISADLNMQYTHNRLRDHDSRKEFRQNTIGALVGISVFF